MANNVMAQVLGGEKKVLDGVVTVKDVKDRLGAPTHTAFVNNEPQSDSYYLKDRDFVSLSQAVKGGSE